MQSAAAEARARRAARKVDLIACKSRWRAGTRDNRGGFRLVDWNNCIVAGEKFDLGVEDVIEFCRNT